MTMRINEVDEVGLGRRPALIDVLALAARRHSSRPPDFRVKRLAKATYVGFELSLVTDTLRCASAENVARDVNVP